ncbi:MAG: hypothetical protein EBX52_07790 [Proteobacteria bacterium]|nr:hypothetical protein [Pseudomonadota bacterium]
MGKPRQFNILKLFSLILLCGGLMSSVSGAASVNPRLQNARELLGGSFKKKVIRKGKEEVEISDFVAETTRRFLPKKHKARAQEVSNALVNAAEEFDLDPVFLMAVVQNESSFDPGKKGSAGEIGVMQILPVTAKWIAGLYSLDYSGPKSLYDPVTNIWIGAALIDRLRHQFDSQGHLYLSAYNLGPKKVRTLISANKIPKAYVKAVLNRYIALYDGYKAKGDLELLSQKAVRNIMNLTN